MSPYLLFSISEPPPPSKLQAYSDLYHITISWIMKPIAVKYQIRLSLMSVNDKVESMHTFETEETEYTFDNLKPASTYSVAVNAISISGIEGDERSTKFITSELFRHRIVMPPYSTISVPYSMLILYSYRKTQTLWPDSHASSTFSFSWAVVPPSWCPKLKLFAGP